MNPWLIFGAGKGTGAHLLDLAIAEKRPVVAVIRDADQAKILDSRGITTLVGDACDTQCVEQACQLAGSQAIIISTMGGQTANYQAHRTIIDCAEKYAISRMLMVTSLGCGSSWPTLSDRAKAAFGYAVREKTLAESWLQTSSLTYTILRPGGLMDGEATQQAQLYPEKQEIHGYVRRIDLAKLIVDIIKTTSHMNIVYSVVDPSLGSLK